MLTLILLAVVVGLVFVLAALYWRRDRIGSAWGRLVDFVVRFRTWLIAGAGTLLMVLPDVLYAFVHDPDVKTILPVSAQHWIGAVALVLTLWSRFRPATRAADPEVLVKQEVKSITASGQPAQIMVGPAGGDITHHDIVPPKGK